MNPNFFPIIATPQLSTILLMIHEIVSSSAGFLYPGHCLPFLRGFGARIKEYLMVFFL
jgi:hypothetical protein